MDTSKNVIELLESSQLMFMCLGCNDIHVINYGLGTGPRWAWNNDLIKPTISPSILVKSGHYASHYKPGNSCWCTYNANSGNPVSFKCGACHSFVNDGNIQFLSDCTHSLAGKTVPIPIWEDDKF